MLLLTLINLFAALAVAQTKYIFVFGESYSMTMSDFGYPPANNSYPNPSNNGVTTSGGANWVDVLVNDLAPKSTRCFNNAITGAAVDGKLENQTATIAATDMVHQIKNFKTQAGGHQKAIPWTGDNSLFIFWFGMTDVFATSMKNGDKIESGIFDSFFQGLKTVYEAGGRKFMILGMPPFYRAPYFMKGGKHMKSDIQKAGESWNNGLAQRANQFQKSHPDAILAGVDTAAIFNKILNSPRKYGASDAECANKDGKTCLWWDNMHPGIAIHNATGRLVYSAMQEMGSNKTSTKQHDTPTDTFDLGSLSSSTPASGTADGTTIPSAASPQKTGGGAKLSISSIAFTTQIVVGALAAIFSFL